MDRERWFKTYLLSGEYFFKENGSIAEKGQDRKSKRSMQKNKTEDTQVESKGCPDIQTGRKRQTYPCLHAGHLKMSVCRGVRRVTDMSISNLQGKNAERIQKKQKNLNEAGW